MLPDLSVCLTVYLPPCLFVCLTDFLCLPACLPSFLPSYLLVCLPACMLLPWTTTRCRVAIAPWVIEQGYLWSIKVTLRKGVCACVRVCVCRVEPASGNRIRLHEEIVRASCRERV